MRMNLAKNHPDIEKCTKAAFALNTHRLAQIQYLQMTMKTGNWANE